MNPDIKRKIEVMYNNTFELDKFNESNDVRGGFRLGITETLAEMGIAFIIAPRNRNLKII